MKKVLQAYKEYYPSRGGVITCMENIAEALKTKCKNIIICTRKRRHNTSYRHQEEVIECKSFGNLLSLPISFSYIFKLLYKASKADVIIHHFPMPLNDLALGIFTSRKVKLIIFWHSDIIEKKQKLFLYFLTPFIRLTLARADKILVNNPFIISESKFLSQHKNKCEVIPFGVKTDELNFLSPQDELLIEKLHRTYGKFFLSIGRLVKYKGYEYLIAAIKETNCKVIIIGEGKLEKRLKNLIKKNKLEQQIFIIGNCSADEIKAYLHACRCLVLPSITRNETFAIVQIEAMALGKPIINTKLDNGVNWVARAKEEAMTVPPQDAKSLRLALQEIWHNDDLAQQLGNAAKKRCKSMFSFKKFCQQINKIL